MTLRALRFGDPPESPARLRFPGWIRVGRRPGLAGWLAIITAALVTLAVAAVSIFGIRLLRDLAEAEALTRVEFAVAAAQETLRQSTEDILTATRVLGERPTLQRLLRSTNLEPVAPYLARYCEGAALDGCAVVRGATVLATSGTGVEWPQVLEAAAEQGERFLATGVASGAPVGGARAMVPEQETVSVLAVRRMDESFSARLSERAGLEIHVLDYATFEPGAGSFAVLHSDAISRGTAVAGYVEALRMYAASVPVAAATGEIVALLQARLPQAQVMAPVARLTRQLLLVAIVVALIATTAGILIGRHWIGGVKRLTDSARRIGAGDLGASIPAEGGKELAVLAATMEDMRRSLVGLTTELRRSEAEAKAVLGGIVEGVYAVDEQRRVRFLNPQAEQVLGLTTAEAIGRFCGDVLKPVRDAEGRRPCETHCPILEARRAGSARAAERLEPTPGRMRQTVIASAAPADGLQVQVLRDETELEAVRRTRDTVLANISHEFRTPLAAQLASIELLQDGLERMAPSARRQLVLSLQRGTQRLTRLIDNLLESVRIESGQLGIRRQEVVLADVIESARDLIGPLIEQRQQRVEVMLSAELPVIRGDEQRLTQVLVNLLANASKFGPPDSVIRIGAQAGRGAGIVFWVEDEGAGPDDLADEGLFERFHRAGGEDPQESGLGLGLFIVRSIVERHGGRARLLRTAESRTRAEVDLPGEVANEDSAGG